MKEKTLIAHPDFGDLTLYHAGLESCESGHSWGPGIRDHFVVHAVRSGRGRFEAGGRVFHLGPSDCFASFPNEVCSYRADRDFPWDYAWIGFHGIKAAAYLERGGLSSAQPIVRLAEEASASFRSLVERMLASKSETADIATLGLLYQTVALLSGPPRRHGTENACIIEETESIIRRGLSLPLTVSDLAEKIGVHRSHLYRLFRGRYGISPHRYIVSAKMERAKELLADGRLSIRGVAESVGYPDQLEFSRAFKRYAGISPKKWSEEE